MMSYEFRCILVVLWYFFNLVHGQVVIVYMTTILGTIYVMSNL